MKINNDIKILYKRDFKYNLLYIGVMFLFVVASLISFFSQFSKSYMESSLSSKIYFMDFMFVLLMFQFFRWIYFENNHLEINILPVSTKNRVLYDLQVGCGVILIWNVFSFLVNILMTKLFIDKSLAWHASLGLNDFLKSNYSDFYLYDINSFFENLILMLIFYLIFILVKYVCSNRFCALGLYISMGITFGKLYDLLNKYDIGFIIKVFLLLVLACLGIGIAYCIKHRDISKGYFYYFKGFEIYQCLFVSAVTVWATYQNVKGVDYIKWICSIFMGILIFIGLYYVLGNHRKNIIEKNI